MIEVALLLAVVLCVALSFERVLWRKERAKLLFGAQAEMRSSQAAERWITSQSKRDGYLLACSRLRELGTEIEASPVPGEAGVAQRTLGKGLLETAIHLELEAPRGPTQ